LPALLLQYVTLSARVAFNCKSCPEMQGLL
jgi:hypothetical protein